MDRRSFLSSLALLGVQGCLMDASGAIRKLDAEPNDGRARRRRKGPVYDDNLVCLISDLHTNPGAYQPARLERTIADILALDPLPRNVIALGDLAYLLGKPEEYARLKEILVPLEASDIRLTLAMGNHDRRAHFAEAFPGYAAASELKDRFVYVVETPRVDFIVLDSLQESTDPRKWITPGALDDGQRAWLQEKLAAYKDKPVFVMSHHPLGEIGIRDLLLDCPTCCGYIHGHDHVWRPGWSHRNYRDRDLIRTLCVPSTGHWGDIGYTLLELGETSAVARLHQYEFFFPNPLAEGEAKPAQWSMIEEEHRDALCRFAYR
ncbi:MAG: metallophosphoesterase [Bacteroidales bacterium]|nr:metallophosphoesterase [Bacteroidales bacterium]